VSGLPWKALAKSYRRGRADATRNSMLATVRTVRMRKELFEARLGLEYAIIRADSALARVAELEAELARSRIEVDRLTYCHVCGDALDIIDGRCELHANVEDETDYWHQGGERFECGCEYCKANDAGNQAVKASAKEQKL